MMEDKNVKTLLSGERFEVTIERLCHQLIERYDTFDNTCLIGIQTKGVFLASRIQKRLLAILNTKKIDCGKLDITFYRDDFRTRQKPIKANATEIDFLVENKYVVLIDDVVYTGRTIQAALTALNHYGRPLQVELLALVDRRFNRHLPIKSDYVGMTVDSVDEAYIKVEWKETSEEDRVLLFS